MAIIIRLDRVLADRKMQMNDLAEKVGISNVNMSNLKTGKVKAIRFSTLEAICKYLNCQPGDILEYRPDEKNIQE
ncbi:MAG: helix-turn-helix domain-containing protein [Dehalococcoidales bacterium]